MFYFCWRFLEECFAMAVHSHEEDDVPVVERKLIHAKIERPLRRSRSNPSLSLVNPVDEPYRHNPHVGYFLLHSSKGGGRSLPPRPILKRVVRRLPSKRVLRFNDRVTVVSPLAWDK